MRCQLVLSSIASIGSQVPGELLVETVRNGVLPPRQALHWLEYKSDEARVQGLDALAPHLPAALLGEALRAASAISDDWSRAEALSGLAPHLQEKLQKEALSTLIQSAERLGRPHFLGSVDIGDSPS